MGMKTAKEIMTSIVLINIILRLLIQSKKIPVHKVAAIELAIIVSVLRYRDFSVSSSTLIC